MRIKVEQQDNGMWLAEMPESSALLAWGDTREAALLNLQLLNARLNTASVRPQTSDIDHPRDDWANQIHMVLCALFPIIFFFLALLVFKWPAEIAAMLCFIIGVASMFVLTPLTGWIYFFIARIRYGEVPRMTRVHTTDAGCSSLIFVIFFLILFPVVQKAREKAIKRRNSNAIHQREKPRQ